MARGAKNVAKTKSPVKPKITFHESELKKGEVRKLNALRRCLGDNIANRAFADWIASQPGNIAETDNKNAELIAEILIDKINQGTLLIPRSGYLVRRGRGRMILESAAE